MLFGRFFGVLNHHFNYWSKMGSKRPFGSILEGFWKDFGDVWGGFWKDLEPYEQVVGRFWKCLA
jgi:hypothetical protein